MSAFLSGCLIGVVVSTMTGIKDIKDKEWKWGAGRLVFVSILTGFWSYMIGWEMF